MLKDMPTSCEVLSNVNITLKDLIPGLEDLLSRVKDVLKKKGQTEDLG